MGNSVACCGAQKSRGALDKRKLSVSEQRERYDFETRLQVMLKEEEGHRLFWELADTAKAQVEQPGQNKLVVGVLGEALGSRSLTWRQKQRALLFLKELMELRSPKFVLCVRELLPFLETFASAAPGSGPAPEREHEAELRGLVLEFLAHWAEQFGEAEPEYRNVVQRLRHKGKMDGVSLQSPRFYRHPPGRVDAKLLQNQVLTGLLDEPLNRAQVQALIADFEQLPPRTQEENLKEKVFFAKVKEFLAPPQPNKPGLYRFLLASYADEEPVAAVLRPLLEEAEREAQFRQSDNSLPSAIRVERTPSRERNHPGTSERLTFGLELPQQGIGTPLRDQSTVRSQMAPESANRLFLGGPGSQDGGDDAEPTEREAEQLRKDIEAREREKMLLERQLQQSETGVVAATSLHVSVSQRGSFAPKPSVERILWDKEEAIYNLKSTIEEINHMLAARKSSPLEAALDRERGENGFVAPSPKPTLVKGFRPASTGHAFVDEIYSAIEHSLAGRARPVQKSSNF